MTDETKIASLTRTIRGNEIAIDVLDDGTFAACPFGRKTYTSATLDNLVSRLDEAMARKTSTRRKRPNVHFAYATRHSAGFAVYQGINLKTNELLVQESDAGGWVGKRRIVQAADNYEFRVFAQAPTHDALTASVANLLHLQKVAQEAQDAVLAYMKKHTIKCRLSSPSSWQETETKIRTETSNSERIRTATTTVVKVDE